MSARSANGGGARPVWALVPTKCFRRGKSRLAAVLDDDARARLTRELFDHVLSVVAACPALAGVLVPTDCRDVAARARRLGVPALVTAAPLRESVDAALETLARDGARGALVLMSDLPRLAAADVAAMAALLDEHEVVVAPDARDQGTNALGVRLPLRLPTCFGNEDSFARHVRAARAAGLSIGQYRHARTGFDIDTPYDLARTF